MEERTAYMRKWFAEHKEQTAIRHREWCASHKKEHIAHSHKWRASHRKEASAYSRKYCSDHKEKVAAYQHEWRASHPDKIVADRHAYRARKVGNGGKFTGQEWRILLEKYNYTCLCCGRDDIKLSADHVIPIKQGGTSYISNIQPLCKSCNSKKHDKYVDYRYGQ